VRAVAVPLPHLGEPANENPVPIADRCLDRKKEMNTSSFKIGQYPVSAKCLQTIQLMPYP